MLKVNNISFAYEKDPVLRDISFQISAGEWLGLLGPNGSGKTTLIKCLSRNLRPQRGSIGLGGKDLSSYRQNELARTVAVVPQDTSMIFPFSAFEVVLMGRSPFAKSFGFESRRDIETAERSMDLTGTWGLKDRMFNELSGGEKQRVIIARALAQEPRVLLMDEPTSFLDIKHQHEILSLLKRLNEERGLTIISAMHDINSALLHCRTIMLMKGGRANKIGPTGEVVTYASLKDVFDTEVYVGMNDLNGKPYYLPY